MKNANKLLVTVGIVAFVILAVQCTHEKKRNAPDESGNPNSFDASIRENADDLLEKGKAVFRFETFGDEAFWTDKLQLHKAIADSTHGGNGAGLSPKAALAAGLKARGAGWSQDQRHAHASIGWNRMTPEQERRFRRLLHDLKAASEGGTANDRGDFTWDELDAVASEFMTGE